MISRITILFITIGKYRRQLIIITLLMILFSYSFIACVDITFRSFEYVTHSVFKKLTKEITVTKTTNYIRLN